MQPLPLPDPVRETLQTLEAAGCETWLVGRCVRQLLEQGTTRDFECLCRASSPAVLRALPQAVVTGAGARRLTAPTAAGPVDILPVGDAALDPLLGRRDFTLHAMAYRPRDATLRDPHGGRRDLEARRLSAPGAAKERLAEDPVRALRALRLLAVHGFEPDADLLAAMSAQAQALQAMGGRRVRIELEGMLLGAHAGRALSLLRQSGLEATLAPGTRPDAPAVVERLPRDLELRTAAWLRGTRVRAVLRDLRCPRDRSLRIERLLQLHPVAAGTSATREARARRLLRRDAAQREQLLALCEAEVAVSGDPAARRSLDRLLHDLEVQQRARQVSAQRSRLCIDGREVMEILGCGPGATVGAALRHLAEQVTDDPTRNDPETLRRLLTEWARRDGRR